MTESFRERPCHSCPYRQDVPSGIWAESEYVKLPEYDKQTSIQPFRVFHCHDRDGSICRGWWDCHSQNPPGHELISVRILGVFGQISDVPPPSDVPCFTTGQEACDHGVKMIDNPDEDACHRVELLTDKHPDMTSS